MGEFELNPQTGLYELKFEDRWDEGISEDTKNTIQGLIQTVESQYTELMTLDSKVAELEQQGLGFNEEIRGYLSAHLREIEGLDKKISELSRKESSDISVLANRANKVDATLSQLNEAVTTIKAKIESINTSSPTSSPYIVSGYLDHLDTIPIEGNISTRPDYPTEGTEYVSLFQKYTTYRRYQSGASADTYLGGLYSAQQFGFRRFIIPKNNTTPINYSDKNSPFYRTPYLSPSVLYRTVLESDFLDTRVSNYNYENFSVPAGGAHSFYPILSFDTGSVWDAYEKAKYPNGFYEVLTITFDPRSLPNGSYVKALPVATNSRRDHINNGNFRFGVILADRAQAEEERANVIANKVATGKCTFNGAQGSITSDIYGNFDDKGVQIWSTNSVDHYNEKKLVVIWAIIESVEHANDNATFGIGFNLYCPKDTYKEFITPSNPIDVFVSDVSKVGKNFRMGQFKITETTQFPTFAKSGDIMLHINTVNEDTPNTPPQDNVSMYMYVGPFLSPQAESYHSSAYINAGSYRLLPSLGNKPEEVQKALNSAINTDQFKEFMNFWVKLK